MVTAEKDLEGLAPLTSFPEELLKSVEMAEINNFQPSMAGFSISDGGSANINFGVVDGVLTNALNNY